MSVASRFALRSRAFTEGPQTYGNPGQGATLLGGTIIMEILLSSFPSSLIG